MSSLSYRAAGVDIEAGNRLVDRIKPFAKRTMRPEVLGGIGGFGALVDLPKRYREPVLVSGTDGVGTKLKLAFELDRHSTIGIDLVAMCVNDIAVSGAEPLFFLDYFACGKLDVERASQVISGIARGCELAGCALVGGETAEMPGMYHGGDYDLAGFAVGVVEKSAIIDGKKVRAGQILLGVDSSGAHSNGYSLIRKILERTPDWQQIRIAGEPLADALMRPTTIYVPLMLDLHRELQVAGMAHITGGGLTENIIRVIPDGLGIVLQRNALTLPPLFGWLQEQGELSEAELFRTFNSGLGLVVVLEPEQVAPAQLLLAKHGLNGRLVGEVIATAGAERVVYV
jgi:phosphoribosylformylglycinamidine cyclo-ligase